MPVASAADLEAWVLQRLDEVTQPGSQAAVEEEVIRQELEEAAIEVLSLAPLSLCTLACRSHKTTAEAAKVSVNNTSGTLVAYRLPLPDDFLRIARVKLSGWTVTLQEEDVLSAEGAIAQAVDASEHTPTARYPYAALGPYVSESADGTQSATYALHVRPVTSGDTVAELLYIPMLAAVNVPQVLQDAMVWLAVARIAATYLKDSATAEAASVYAESSLARRVESQARLSKTAKEATAHSVAVSPASYF